jgi:hypothetical protein
MRDFTTCVPLEIPLSEVAWLAGFFDGEGSVCIVRTRPNGRRQSDRYDVTVTIGNTSKPALQRFAAAFGGNVILARSEARAAPMRQALYRWKRTNWDALTVLLTLRPFLFVKLPQCDLALRTIEERVSAYRGGAYMPADELARRHAFYQEMQALNRSWRGR